MFFSRNLPTCPGLNVILSWLKLASISGKMPPLYKTGLKLEEGPQTYYSNIDIWPFTVEIQAGHQYLHKFWKFASKLFLPLQFETLAVVSVLLFPGRGLLCLKGKQCHPLFKVKLTKDSLTLFNLTYCKNESFVICNGIVDGVCQYKVLLRLSCS